MPGYSTTSRFSLIQLHSEKRKQRAHLKKISEMQRRSGLDNGEPFRLPHLHQTFLKQLHEKRVEIDKENEMKVNKLLQIMAPKSIRLPTPSHHPTNQTPRNHSTQSTHNNDGYLERIAKAKGQYNVREWEKQNEQRKEYLKLRKDNSVFTPLDMGVNKKRIIRTTSLMFLNSKQTTPTSSSHTIGDKHDKNSGT
jgi:hypothetical protein